MIFQYVNGLIQQAIKEELIEQADNIYVRNQVMNLLNLETFPEEPDCVTDESIPDMLEKIIEYAIEHEVIEDVFDDKEILTANIMNCFVARPSVIHAAFNEKYEQSPKAATDYFYNLSKNSNYIQMNRIEKNIHGLAHGRLFLPGRWKLQRGRCVQPPRTCCRPDLACIHRLPVHPHDQTAQVAVRPCHVAPCASGARQGLDNRDERQDACEGGDHALVRNGAVPRLDWPFLHLGKPGIHRCRHHRRPCRLVLRDLGGQQLRARQVAGHAPFHLACRHRMRRRKHRLHDARLERPEHGLCNKIAVGYPL